jgi:hypothetical protein
VTELDTVVNGGKTYLIVCANRNTNNDHFLANFSLLFFRSSSANICQREKVDFIISRTLEGDFIAKPPVIPN